VFPEQPILAKAPLPLLPQPLAGIMKPVNIALKEWAVVIEALARGKQRFLLRKGGIAEGKRGFEVKHREFLFYPTWEHQQIESVRPEFHELFEQTRPRQPAVVRFRYLAKVTDILQAPPVLEAMPPLESDHIWTPAYLEMRYRYRPERPLFILFVRLYGLETERKIPENRRYGGCRSWVTLDEEIEAGGAAPVEPDGSFESARKSLIGKLLTQQARPLA